MSRNAILAVGLLLLVLSLAPGCAERRPAVTPTPGGDAATLPEEAVGLSPGRLESLPPLASMPTPPGDPGDVPPGPAAYDGAPPVVPHAVLDFLPIERDANACLDCHGKGEPIAGEPSPVPTSHYVDLRDAPDTSREDVAGARWVCTACHVPVTDAPPLVASEF